MKKHKYGNASQVTDHLAPKRKKKVKKMAGGGHVKGYADGGEVKKKVGKKTSKKKPRRPTPETLGTGMAAEGARRILSARERREREAGL